MIDLIDPRTGELMDTDSIPGLADVAALHDDQIRLLATRVEEIDAAGDGPLRPSAWTWRGQSTQAAEQLWLDLADWVGWLRGRYPLARQVPPCWWRHPELVEELTAVWVAWREAYENPKAPMTAPIDWHDRWLPSFLRRVGSGGWNIGCTDEHDGRVAGAYGNSAVDNEEEFQAFIRRDSYEPTRESAPGAATEGDTVMDHQQMLAALESGQARLIGSLPGSPVAYVNRYWLQAGDHWEAIGDESMIDFLDDAERRLELADSAVDAHRP